jgi:alpha-D-xyloside xylohydrolase
MGKPTYEVPRFLGDPPVPVSLIAEAAHYRVLDDAVVFTCRARLFTPVLHNYYGSITETVWDAPVDAPDVSVRIDICTPEIVRLRIQPGAQVADNITPMMVESFAERPAFTVYEQENRIIIDTGVIQVITVREPWQIIVIDRSGAVIWATRPIDIEGLRRPQEQWNPPQQRWIFYHRYAYPVGTAAHGDRQHVFLSCDLAYDEHIYGFGESFGRLDKRETEQTLWIQEGFSNASPATYKRTPFYMSSRGYGLYLNTANAVRCHVGEREHTALSVIIDDTDLIDAYFIYGPDLKAILPRYTRITGQPAVPPKWSFGLWMARISYSRQEQVEAVARDLRAHRIPCDVIHIDTDWYEHDWVCDLRFGPSKFPDPAGMTARLREQGFRVSLWQWPNMLVNSPMFLEGYSYLARQKNGKPYIFPGFEAPAGYIDYSSEEAVRWIQEKFRALFDLGVAAIKVDFGEGASPDAVYAGMESSAAHSLYPLLYNRAIWEVTESYFGKGEAVVWARSAWAGSQRYPVHWSGDGVARFEDLACVLRAALSFGMSGFPFYSHDIGGFSGLPSPELYVRWGQFGLFSSHARAHGVPPREPWAYGEEAEAIFRRYALLRYQLMPYIFSEAVRCGMTSLPMVRALVLEFQDDPNTFTLDDQYLFGESLLIAPILSERNTRRVYLPEGLWTDFWTKATHHGGRWLTIDAPLDTLPIFVRQGALLPFTREMQYVDQDPSAPLTLELYHPSARGEYTLYHHDGRDRIIRFAITDGRLTLDADVGLERVVVYGTSIVNGSPLPDGGYLLDMGEA